MNKILIGDYVEDAYGFKGSVYQEYNNFYATPMITMTHKEWLDNQILSYTKFQLFEKWFSIHNVDGGSTLTCESHIKLIRRIDIDELF